MNAAAVHRCLDSYRRALSDLHHALNGLTQLSRQQLSRIRQSELEAILTDRQFRYPVRITAAREYVSRISDGYISGEPREMQARYIRCLSSDFESEDPDRWRYALEVLVRELEWLRSWVADAQRRGAVDML